MTSTTKSGALTRSAAAKQMTGIIPAAFTAADSTSADRIQHLSLINQARVSRLSRTAASATAQYGAQSTQATAAQAAVAAGNATVARVQVLHNQATTPAPSVAATGWALHGRVYDAQLKPVSGHTVFLVDSQKTYQESAGFAYTDSTGYFLINYPGTPAAATGAATAAAASSTTPATTPATTPGAAAAPAATLSDQLFVQIANPSGKPVYLSATPFQPAAGTATYQNTTLPAGEPALGDPPAAIRKFALPPKK